MATPKVVARSLKKSATRLAGVQDETVRRAGEDAVEAALNIGGTFGRRRMIAEVVSKRSSKKRSEVTIWPKPAYAWSIDAFGRGEVRPRRRRVLRFYIGTDAVFTPRAKAAGPYRRRLQAWQSEIGIDNLVDAASETVREALG